MHKGNSRTHSPSIAVALKLFATIGPVNCTFYRLNIRLIMYMHSMHATVCIAVRELFLLEGSDKKKNMFKL